MEKRKPIMPKATAVWLIQNTSLTFKQIAEFCVMHELEIKGIADGEVAQGIIGVNPVTQGQITKEELERCSKDPSAKIQLRDSNLQYLAAKKPKTKYTPVARRRDKPDAIFWLLKNCPNIPDNRIARLIGTTKTTIDSIKEKSHWNMKNLKPRDPVLLGLCTQSELDVVLEKYSAQSIDAEKSE